MLYVTDGTDRRIDHSSCSSALERPRVCAVDARISGGLMAVAVMAVPWVPYWGFADVSEAVSWSLIWLFCTALAPPLAYSHW